MENEFVNHIQNLGLKTSYGCSVNGHLILFNYIMVAEYRYRYNFSSIIEKGLSIDLNIDIMECCVFRDLTIYDSRYELKHTIYGKYALEYKPYKSLSYYGCDYENEDVATVIDFDELTKSLEYSVSRIKNVLVDIEKKEIRNEND